MPSREELSKLLFIFQLTLVECPKVCSQADERVREKKGAKTLPYKVQLRTEHIWSVKMTQEGIDTVSKYLRCDNVRQGFSTWELLMFGARQLSLWALSCVL